MNYVIYGEEKLLMEQKLDQLKKEYHISEEDMNIMTYWCNETPMKDIIDGAIVGSHFITLLEENNFSTIAAANYCNKFKQDLNNL